VTVFPNILGTKDWVLSEEYTIVAHKPTNHPDFIRCGAWRWGAMYDNRKLIASHVFDEKQRGIDFGGHDGPIGGYTEVIDIQLNNSLDDILDENLDYIFTSHTLEHVINIESVLRKMFIKLKNGGKIMIHVPAYSMRKWLPENDPDHVHAFKLEGRPHPRVQREYPQAILLDKLLKEIGFKIIVAEYCYKHCIFIYGEKIGQSM